MSDIPTTGNPAAEAKRRHLREQGMQPIGWIFIDPATNRRATLDYFGRVQRWDVDSSGRMHAESVRVAELEAENGRLRQDAARLDWLADRDNAIGNVQLPAECVVANLGSMRSAIDMAMALNSEGDPA